MQHPPLLLRFMEQEKPTNTPINQPYDVHSRHLETLSNTWPVNEDYCHLRMAIDIHNDICIPTRIVKKL